MNKKLKIFITIAITLFFEIFMYFQLISNKIEDSGKSKMVQLIFIGLCLVTNVLLFIVYRIMKKKNNLKIENVFLIISVCFGMIYLFFIPSMLGTDELPHFLRSYQISVGDVVVKNPEKNSTYIPRGLSEITNMSEFSKRYSKDKIFESTDYKDKVKILNSNVTSIKYSPIPYLPQIIGFKLAKLLRLSPIFTLFCVRSVNFLTWLFFGYLAIRLLPSKKIFATILYTSPAVLSLVSTCSGDTFALGMMFLMFAYILNMIKNGKKVSKVDYAILLALSLGLSTYKMFYVLYILLLFIIPKKSFKNTYHKLLFVCSIFSLSIALDYFWFYLTSINSTIQNPVVTKQLHFIFSHPFYYFMTFINTFAQDLYYYISNIVGGSEMCYSIVRLNQIFVIPYLIILVSLYYDGEKNVKLCTLSKTLIVVICCLIIGLVSTAMYLDWTSHKLGIGSNIIIGVQARYFIPLIIPIISILPNVKKKIKINNKLYFLVILLDALLVINTINSILIALVQS